MDGGGQNIYGRRICQKGSLAHNRDVCPALVDRPRFNNCPGFDSHTQGTIETNTNTDTNKNTDTNTNTNANKTQVQIQIQPHIKTQIQIQMSSLHQL